MLVILFHKKLCYSDRLIIMFKVIILKADDIKAHQLTRVRMLS